MGANPQHVCDEHEFTFPEGADDYCVACGMREVDYQRIVKLESEIEDWEQSFNLYDDACRRGTKLWQEEGGYLEVPQVWPDTANLVAWLIAKLDTGAAREYAEASGRTGAEGRIDFAKLEIWKLVFPYISEDNIAYTEENMEVLCEDVLPKIYDSILHAQQAR